jgi:hypothetical protein
MGANTPGSGIDHLRARDRRECSPRSIGLPAQPPAGDWHADSQPHSDSAHRFLAHTDGEASADSLSHFDTSNPSTCALPEGQSQFSGSAPH